jgi:hypothetical protein
MRKIGKVLAVLVIILAGMVTIIVLALPRFIDLNAYRGYIQSLVKSTTGKDIDMGTVGISLWKGVEVYGTDIQVREKRENLMQPVLKAEKISAQVALLPLLRKKIRVSNIIIHSPEIDYRIGEGNPFGSLLLLSNIGSLVRQEVSDFPLEKGETEKKSNFLSGFSFDPSGLSKVEVKKGSIELQKILTSGDLLSLVLDKIYLNIDQSQEPSSFFIDAKASFPESGGDLYIKGTLGYPKEKGKMLLQISLDADISKGRIFSEPLLSLTGIGVDSGRMDIKSEISGLLGGEINVQSEGMFEDLLLKGSAPSIYQGQPLKGTFTFKGNMENSVLDIEEVKIHIGQSVIMIDGNVDLKEASPLLRFSIQGKAINYSEIRDLMPLLQFQPPSYIEGGTIQMDLRGKAQLGSFSIKEITGESVLNGFAIMADSLPAPIQDIQCQVKVSEHALDLVEIKALHVGNPIDGTIHIADLAAPESTFDFNVLGGRAKGNLAFPKREEGDYLLRMEAEEIDTNSFISMLSPTCRDMIHGQLAGKMQLNSAELMAENVIKNLKGSGSFNIKEGKITTFGLLEQVGKILNLMGGKGIGKEETPFESLEGQFHLMQGTLKIENLFLTAPDITLMGGGAVHQDSSIDFSFHASFSQDVSQAMVASTPLLKYRMEPNGELSFPLKVAGDINQPRVSFDLNKILERSTKKKIFNKIKDFLNR